jgi:diacylglycerol kinase family enzyme
MNACLILNEGARTFATGKGRITATDVIAAFRSAGIDVHSHIASGDALEETLKKAIAAGPDAIFVGGGDGSISTAAQCLTGTDLPLGVLPLGTLNHFAHDLGLPADWREAVTALASGEHRDVDVAEVNGRTFINNCSLGAYADAVRKRDALRQLERTGKWWAMLRATIAVFRRLRRIRVRIEVAGQTHALRSPFVVVANNRYSGHVLDHSLRARLDEGRLWIYTTHARRHATILHFIWQALLRRLDEINGLDTIETAEASIAHDYPSLPIAIDGELVDLKAPLQFRIRPRALRVIVPRGKEKRP